MLVLLKCCRKVRSSLHTLRCRVDNSRQPWPWVILAKLERSGFHPSNLTELPSNYPVSQTIQYEISYRQLITHGEFSMDGSDEDDNRSKDERAYNWLSFLTCWIYCSGVSGWREPWSDQPLDYKAASTLQSQKSINSYPVHETIPSICWYLSETLV